MSISLLSMQLQNIDRDFKGESLLRTCSFATNLVTPLEYNPIHTATMLCGFGQTRNGSVVNHFSSTSTNSATSGYVLLPERVGQNEEPASQNEERTRNKHRSAPKTFLNDAQWNHLCL